MRIRLILGRGSAEFAFEPAMEPAYVEVGAEEGVAEHLVEHAFGGVDFIDVAEGWPG